MEILPILLIIPFMYVLFYLPERRRRKEHQALLRALQPGDEVLMESGIYGFIADMDGEILWLEVADKVELRVAKSKVAGKIPVPADDEAEVADTVEDS